MFEEFVEEKCRNRQFSFSACRGKYGFDGKTIVVCHRGMYERCTPAGA
jgi:hypothetical protein